VGSFELSADYVKKLDMSTWPRPIPLLVVILAGIHSAPIAAQDLPLLSPDEVRVFEARGWLERDPAQVSRILGPYAARTFGQEKIRAEDVRIARLEALECAIGRVVARKLGLAQFLSDPLFRGSSSSLVVLVDGATLARLDQVFNLHSMFPARVKGSGAEQASMLFLLAGQGKVLVGYDRAATYRHPDDAFEIFGNRDYAVYPFLRMTIGTHNSRPALLEIGVADGPTGGLHPYEKQVLLLRAAIHGLFIDGQEVTADTSVINRKLVPPPIEWRNGEASGAASLRQLNCAVGRP
jgi:hypothetical protein